MLSLQSDTKHPELFDLSNERDEIEALRQQLKTLKSSLNDAKARHTSSLHEEAQARLEVVAEVEALNRQITGLKVKLADAQRLGAAEAELVIVEREKEIAALKEALALADAQHKHDVIVGEQHFQAMSIAQAAREESEEHLKAAHQHLSKKVRETTELAEKIKGLEAGIEETKAIMDARGEALALLEQTMQVLVQKENALQRENQELRRCFEERQELWEEKLSYMQSQLSQAQHEHERLKVYEERCQQIARHWDSMGKVLWEQRSQETLLKSMVARQESRSHHLLDLSLQQPVSIGEA